MKSLLRRRGRWPVLVLLTGIVASAGVHGAGKSQTVPYPTKPVRLLVGFQPGGGSDILARAIGQKLSERWEQAVVTDNRSGAGGLIAWEIVAKSAPDGYTLLVISGSQATNLSLVTKVPYDIRKAYAPVTQFTSQPYLMLANASTPTPSVKELIAYAKSRPGALNYASTGTGSFAHLAMELFQRMAKVEMVHVPYKGAGSALIDLIGGHVQLFLSSALAAMPHVKGGKIRALAQTSARRSALLPELPTVAEGGLPGFDVTGWYGLVAPARTPQSIIAKLNQEIGGILRSPEIRERLAGDGADAAPSTPAQFGKTIAAEIEKWTEVVASAKLSVK